MVIGVDATELSARPAGKGQYLQRILLKWVEDPGLELVLYVGKNQTVNPRLVENTPAKVRLVQQAGRGPLWHRVVAKRLKHDGVQVFLAGLSYQSAIFNSLPTVTVVHDLAVFKLTKFRHNRKAQIVERLTLGACVSRSRKIVAVSQSTKKDLIEITGIQPSEVVVIPGAAMLMAGREASLPWQEREKFFLFVGTLEPRKNISTILKAFAALPERTKTAYRLKLVGKVGWGGEEYEKMAKELAIDRQVDFLGYVDTEKLTDLYRKAAAFLFPSLYEGFGLPPLEALSVGTPVVTSNISSLPEVVAQGGFLCDPLDFQAMATALATLTSDEKVFAEYSQAGFEWAKHFSWQRSANDLKQILAQVAD